MVVKAVRKALRDRGTATLGQIAAEVGHDRQVVAEALRFWVTRGNVRRIVAVDHGTCSTRCTHCPLSGACSVGGGETAEVEVYEWN